MVRGAGPREFVKFNEKIALGLEEAGAGVEDDSYGNATPTKVANVTPSKVVRSFKKHKQQALRSFVKFDEKVVLKLEEAAAASETSSAPTFRRWIARVASDPFVKTTRNSPSGLRRPVPAS